MSGTRGSGEVVARRYARAMFDLGKKSGLAQLEKYGQELDALRQAMESAPSLQRMFRAPVFSTDEKKAVIDRLVKALGLSGGTANFCRLLADKNRLEYLPGITAVYDELLDVEKGIVRGELVTAVELDDDKRKQVREQLEKQAGRPLALSFRVEPEILGGVMLKVGDRVMDASLRAQLSILKDNIKRGEQGHAD